MKNKLLFLLFVFTSTFVPAQNAAIKNSTIVPPDLKFQSTTVINNLDTVVFDLAQQTITPSTVMFPVYFLSDDTVNALDFSLKFDMSKFSYDTIFNHTNYLTAVFYQAADSVLRLTSYSLQTITNDTPLVSIRFTKLAGVQMCNQDIDSIYSYPMHGYLNGDPCTVKVIECVTTGLENAAVDVGVTIYPNPANEKINVKIGENSTVQLTDITGKEVFKQTSVIANQTQEIKTQNIANGIYLIKIFNEHFSVTKKAVISR